LLAVCSARVALPVNSTTYAAGSPFAAAPGERSTQTSTLRSPASEISSRRAVPASIAWRLGKRISLLAQPPKSISRV
jgi:hypothetical protein